jgi:glycosyltransferase involved in cell wall biosynthesis
MSWGSDLLLKAKRSPWMQYATRFTLAHSDLFFGDCETLAREAISYGLPAEKIVRFPWGVDLEHFSPVNGADLGQALRKALGWEQNFVLMCNRTWAPIYGVDVLAKAFVAAVEENTDLRLLLIGDGPLSEEIHKILAPVRSKASLLGWIDRESLPGAYCAADLFISPSHCDGSSISLLEALACGRPVLVSDIPSNQEWVAPGVVGDLFPDGQVEALKEKILQMSADSQLDQYGRRARSLAEGSADWRKNFEVMLKGYERVVRQM